ncbi:fibrillarin-like rRNA/tRNA 2'-O-methyltransferase [Candidatus Woesearchaeota archaeon]|nr:fibrillarin-like rRNA/tRNA 2'-O-methyltransferase [Candidatus Woesearchaeota archaeon]
MIKPHKFHGIYEEGKKLFTKNLIPGSSFFGEKLTKQGKEEFREWEPSRSKLAAALAKKISQIGIRPNYKVLYLGASHGYTVSFVSDIVGKQGFVFALDFAPRTTRDLVFLCQERSNIAALLADAFQPQTYYHQVMQVDAVFQDIAQRNQVEIFLKNCKVFLKKEGFGTLVIKSRSIDIAKKPKQVFKEAKQQLEKEIIIVDYRELGPFQKDHCIFVCKKK